MTTQPTPTHTPAPSRLWMHFCKTHNMVLTASEESDICHAASAEAEANIRALETELAALRAENERLRPHSLSSGEREDYHDALNALAALRAENERLRYDKLTLEGVTELLKQATARAERAEAALADYKTALEITTRSADEHLRNKRIADAELAQARKQLTYLGAVIDKALRNLKEKC